MVYLLTRELNYGKQAERRAKDEDALKALEYDEVAEQAIEELNKEK